MLRIILASFIKKRAKVFYGAIGGISTSQVSGDQLGGFNKVGVKLGSFVNHPINLATRGELAMYYIEKGSNDLRIKSF